MGNKIFSEQEVKEGEFFGFKYTPSEVPDFGIFKANATGILVGVRLDDLEVGKTVFGDPREADSDDGVYPIYDLPDSVDEKWSTLLTALEKRMIAEKNEPKSYKFPEMTPLLSQGFMNYTFQCLEYLNKTPVGKLLIKSLRESGSLIKIMPSNMGNQITGASSDGAIPPMVRRLLDPRSRFIAGDGLVDLARSIYRSGSDIESLNEMATKMNEMPLYSLFRKKPYEYPDGFLKATFREINNGENLAGKDLLDWFTKGDRSAFAEMLETKRAENVEEASIANYVRIATIILLKNGLGKGSGAKEVRINFNTKFHKIAYPQTRPPAIGLAHELIHAHWATQGEQLGKESSHFSVLLFEFRCVGLGPWKIRLYSENMLRMQWGDLSRKNKMDRYNSLKTAELEARLVYDELSPNTKAELKLARKASHSY